MNLRHLFAAIVLFVPILASCAKEGGEPLSVVARDYGFSGVEDTIKGGIVNLHFRNEGKAEHEFALVRAEDTTIDEFKKGFGAVLEGGPFPRFMTGGAAVGEIGPGEKLRSRFTLPGGTYMLFCALQDEPGEAEEGEEGEEDEPGKPHYDLGMIRQITVEGDEDVPDITAAGGEFAAADYTFETPDTVPAGERTFLFRNESAEQWHHMVLNRFDSDVSEEDAVDAFKTLVSLEEGDAPPEGTPKGDEAGGTGVMGPGFAQTVKLDLKPGTYVAACFIQDTKGGPPHAIAHDMFKAFTVEDA